METFAPSFFNHFSLSLNRFMFIDLLHIKIGNLNWCECGHCKNEAREIDLFFVEKWMQCYCFGQNPRAQGNMSPSSFYGQLPDY